MAPASSLGLRFLATPACLAAHGDELVPRKKPELPPSMTHSEVPPGARSFHRPSPTRSAQPLPMEAPPSAHDHAPTAGVHLLHPA